MITKERLEELIEQVSKVYCLDFNHIYSFDFEEYEGKIESATKCYPNDRLQIRWKKAPIGGIGAQWSEDIYLQDLFETKEEAEWELEFGNITRTEILKVPTWEEFRKLGSFEFYGYHQRRTILFYDIVDDMIKLDNGNGDWYLFMKNHNKENYIEACKLCKKLFLGE